MAYSVNYTEKGKSPIIVSDGVLNSDTSLKLPGRGKVGFGEALNETLVHILENFASPDAYDVIEASSSGNYIEVDSYAFDAFKVGESYTLFNSSTNNGVYLISNVTTIGSPSRIRIEFDASTQIPSTTSNDGLFGNQQEPLPNLVTKDYSTGQLWYNTREDLFYYFSESGTWETIINPGSFTAAVQEAVEDVVGSMVGQMFDSETNIENGISVTYDENDGAGPGLGKLNFDVNDFDISIDGAVTGSATVTNLGNVTISTSVSHNHDTLYVNVGGDTMSGDLNMGGNTVTNLSNPVAGTDAVPFTYAENRYINTSGDTMTGTLNLVDTTMTNSQFMLTGSDVVLSNSSITLQDQDTLTITFQGQYSNYANISLVSTSNSNTYMLFQTFDGNAEPFVFRMNDGVDLLSIQHTTLEYRGNTVWHAGNDGAGSGLDADLWAGSTKYVRTTTPSSSLGSDGDICFVI